MKNFSKYQQQNKKKHYKLNNLKQTKVDYLNQTIEKIEMEKSGSYAWWNTLGHERKRWRKKGTNWIVANKVPNLTNILPCRTTPNKKRTLDTMINKTKNVYPW